MTKPVRILVVCTGNLCRSPMAQAILASHLGDVDGPGTFEIVSAGHRAPEGQPVESTTAAVLDEHLVPLPEHRSRKLTASDVERADLILGMERRHRAAAVRLVPAAASRAFTVRELGRLAANAPDPAPESTARERLDALLQAAQHARGLVRGDTRRDDDIRDPINRAPEVFPATFAAIEESLAPTIARLGGKPPEPPDPAIDTSLAYPEPAISVFRRHRKLKRQFRLGTALTVVGGLLLVVLLYGLALALSARSLTHKVAKVQAQIEQLRQQATADPGADLEPQIAQIQSEAASAKKSAHGVLWDIAAHFPVIGSAAETVQGASTAVSDLTNQALPQVVTAQRLVNSARGGEGGTIRLAPLAQANAPISAAADATQLALARLQALPTHTSVGKVDHARANIITTLQGLSGELDTARDATAVLPTMLGGSGTRNYFLAFQNEAEARGLGGLPGAYAIITAENGKISLTQFGNDSDMGGFTAAGLDLGSEFQSEFGSASPTTAFINSTISPQFPDAAQIWLAMWKAKTGQQLDGALIADPQVLSELLRVTGPTKLPDGTAVTADNVVSLTESEAYARFPENADTPARKAFFIAIAQSVSDHVISSSSGKETAYAHAFGGLIANRRLFVYSNHPEEEKVLQDQPIAGELPPATQPFAMAVVTAAAGQKLDYYLDRSFTYSAGSCRAGKTRTSKQSFVLTNTAPASGLPAYVTNTVGNGLAGEPFGTEQLVVTLYRTKGATVRSATLNGNFVPVVPGSYRGYGTVTLTLNLRPGETGTIEIDMDEPTVAGPAIALVQPLVRAQKTLVSVPTCGQK